MANRIDAPKWSFSFKRQKQAVGVGLVLLAVSGVCGGGYLLGQSHVFDANPGVNKQPIARDFGTPTPTSILSVSYSSETLRPTQTISPRQETNPLVVEACKKLFANIEQGDYNKNLVPMPQETKNGEVIVDSREIVDWYRNVLKVADEQKKPNDPIVQFLKVELGVTNENPRALIAEQDLTVSEYTKDAKYVAFVYQAKDLQGKLNDLTVSMWNYYGQKGQSPNAVEYRGEIEKAIEAKFFAKDAKGDFMKMPVWFWTKWNEQRRTFLNFNKNVLRGEEKFPNGPLSGDDRIAVFVPLDGTTSAKAVVLDDFSRKIDLD
jgi:hypothetical protein